MIAEDLDALHAQEQAILTTRCLDQLEKVEGQANAQVQKILATSSPFPDINSELLTDYKRQKIIRNSPLYVNPERKQLTSKKYFHYILARLNG